ncbi:amidohydrolase [Anaeroselena agilis]|uniref:Amidohydrolase n=1 Tax=Anaeroselena agilis TaxID=3063788 RepID=A0ABU3P4B0_9FIRM|nr:amidohydrolase [Selenomonadales bacterium 4137-cl]
MRRHFRMHPEVGGEEHETQKKILAELAAMGVKARAAGGTGVIADIPGAPGGKTVAMRADIDALPITDEIEQPYRSLNKGICHACGHDGHAAMLLGAAKTFAAMAGELPGNVRLIFQPSEERFPGGAEIMIAAGAMDGVDAVVGAHLWQPLPVGAIGVTNGALMASPDEFTITIQGKGGHGSMPHQTVDSILVASQLVLALRTITGANVDPREQAVLTIGMFKAGEVFNIIPDTAVLKGTVRSFDQSVRDAVFGQMEAYCRGICAASGASYVIDPIFGYPPVVNSPKVTTVIAEAGCEVAGVEVQDVKPLMVGEDFSYYQHKAPGSFFLVGAGNPAKGCIHPHHHPKFDIDEDALGYGAETMVRAVLKLLAR